MVDLLSGVVRARPLSGDEALRELERITALARAGNNDARCELAYHLLANPAGSTVNRRILLLVRPAAAAGHREGLYLLGLLTLRGQGLKQNLEAGAALITRAALAGQLDAQKLLAKLYTEGLGVAADPARALYWQRLAGAAGDAASAREAGMAYVRGQGTAADRTQGRYWLEKAASGADSRAAFELSRLMRGEDSPAGPRDAQFWLREAAITGTLDAQFRLGLQYWSGQGTKVNLREALRWTCRAAEGGSASAIATLSGFFLSGNILPISRFNAYVLALAAEKRGQSTARLTRESLEPVLTYREKRRARHLLRVTPDIRELVEILVPRNER